MIPELYFKAGVTCLGLEACTANQNDQLNQLVTGETFDRQLALTIARGVTWKSWGVKEQWDALETVWQLNRTIPHGQKKMRIIGIDNAWDGPSFALLGIGADAVKGPLVERLRILRIGVLDILRLVKRDELMARNIEKEILEKGERGIIWVGAAHSYTHYRQPLVNIKGTLIGEWNRMAFILHQRHGDSVYQIILHSKSESPKIAYAQYTGPSPQLSTFIERVMAKRGEKAVGFTVPGSPFASLRDSNSYNYHFQPAVSLADVASGYIFLKPWNQIAYCSWIQGYISKEMFIENKPFYEYGIHHTLRNAEEADREVYEFVKRELAK
jgi:hypothetical protein